VKLIMLASDIACHRLMNQRLFQGKFEQPERVVAWFGAMQAQDFTSAKWAIGLRCESATEATIDRAIANREILRTWLLRGTLHIVAADDIHWMLELLAPRLIAGSATRYRQLELDEGTFTRSFDLLAKTMQTGRPFSRTELLQILSGAGISTSGQRGYHILRRAGLEGLICFGPQQEKQDTFVLLDEWAPGGNTVEREHALAELARRYISSHGPATLRDFVWWSGLPVTEARVGIENLRGDFQQEMLEGEAYWFPDSQPALHAEPSTASLLPAFDEFYLGYTTRAAVLNPQYDRQVVSSNGIFRPMLLIDGQILGIWQRELKKGTVRLKLNLFAPLSGVQEQALFEAANLYGAFLGLPVRVESSQ
jgi:hypothetical protein